MSDVNKEVNNEKADSAVSKEAYRFILEATQQKREKRNRVQKICCIILAVVLMGSMAAVGTVSVFDENPTVSEREQRTLEEFPKFSFKSFFDGTYFPKFDLAYNDTFPFRDFWLDRYTDIKDFFTIRSKGGELIDADNEEIDNPDEPEINLEELLAMPFDSTGYEQYIDGTKVSGVAIEGDQAYYIFNGTVTAAENYCNYMKTVQLQFPDNSVVALVCPDAGAFYASEKYSKDNHEVRSWLEMIEKNLQGITVINPYDRMYEHKDEYICFRTDHHWTAYGAYFAYQEICEKREFYCYDISKFKSGKITGFLGSFYSKTSSNVLKKNPDDVYYYEPLVDVEMKIYGNRSSLKTTPSTGKLINPKTTMSNKYTAFIVGDNPLSIITTSCTNNRTCVVVKDSYANALVPWLCNCYSQIYVIDPRHVNTTEDNVLKLKDFMADKTDADIIFCCSDYNAANTSGSYMRGLLRILK